MSDEIPFLIDSMYNAIRHDLYDDPMSPWTQEELDQALEDILWFCSERAQFLSENHPLPGSAVVTDMRIEKTLAGTPSGQPLFPHPRSMSRDTRG